MQFKNPEIFYFLALLIIPILVHLFQLQKFVKTDFTNVAFLQKIIQQNRKSSQIKKWLILATRLLLFLAILFTFSQPYFSNKKASLKQHNFIYLDNSLSTNSEGKKGNLLKTASQEIINNISKKDVYSLQTNSKFYERISKKELKNILLNINYTSKSLDLSSVFLKFSKNNNTKTNTLNKLILITDFQNTYKNKFTNVTPSFSAIKLNSSIKSNISIDSIYINKLNTTDFTLNVVVRNQGKEKNNTPIAVYNNTKLISKLSSSFLRDSKKTIQFKLQNSENFNGKIQITSNDVFSYDNTFYFTFSNSKKINILSIGKASKYLPKIYNKEEFNFSQNTLQNINYNNILKQQLIILNELKEIPEILTKKIIEFSKKGGSLVIIPNENSDINSYNSILGNLNIGKIKSKVKDSLKVTTINYNHPLLSNVFSKKVTNFQYPTTKSHYSILSKKLNNIVSLENNTPFISEIKNANNKIYWVSSSLNSNNSNFTKSPLIVPIFYNFGKLSFKSSKLFYRVGTENNIDIETTVLNDKILRVSNNQNTFIPLQQKFQNKVRLTTNDQPEVAGFYNVLKENDTLQKLAYNYPKEESNLFFLDLNELKNQNKKINISSSIAETFKKINKKNEVHWLWKWFLTLAIVSLLLEIFILKFYKP